MFTEIIREKSYIFDLLSIQYTYIYYKFYFLNNPIQVEEKHEKYNDTGDYVRCRKEFIGSRAMQNI